MKKGIGFFAGFIIVVALFLGLSCMVVTGENEYKLIRQFGKIDHVESEAGLSFKLPFIQTVDSLPKYIQLYDLAPSDVITRDKKTMITNSYVLWQITDPIKFAQTLNGSIGNAENRINTVVYNSIKNIISSLSQEEVISGRDGELTAAILKNMGNTFDQYGIKVLTVETKQLDLPADNKTAVYERMISERENIAATYTAEGTSEAQIIKNSTDKEVSIMISEAEKQAEILKAEGEAEYMKILSDAYADESKTDFYSFVRSLDAVKASITGDNKTVILSEDSPIAQIFNGQ
ncbi:MAG: protease modulator HflC [Lachnospiraceae bacterium]|nr:protease modulator HflC [Lachnospiraceae bacterium]